MAVLGAPYSFVNNNNKRPRYGKEAPINKRVKSSGPAEKNTDYWSNDTSYAFAVVDTNTFINCIDKVNNLKFYNNMQVVVPMIGMYFTVLFVLLATSYYPQLRTMYNSRSSFQSIRSLLVSFSPAIEKNELLHVFLLSSVIPCSSIINTSYHGVLYMSCRIITC